VRIGVVSALGRIGPDGVEGYGGLERAAFWMANELVRRGHEVLLFGNVDAGKSRFGWTGVRLETESDALSPHNYEEIRACEAVNDWCHSKPLRMAPLPNYWATVMFTDMPAMPGRNVYPSQAVRESFREPSAQVVPIGIELEGSHESLPERSEEFASFGRITHHKGTDLSIRAMARQPVPRLFTVAGHVWPGIDEYYAMAMARLCESSGFAYEPDPPNERAQRIVRQSAGLLHLHRWLESFSIVAGEALCYGTPLLTTDQGAPQEWVRATDGGMVVPLKDLEAGRPEANAVVRAFLEENWNGRRQGFAKRARELFDIRRVADRYEALFGEGARK